MSYLTAARFGAPASFSSPPAQCRRTLEKRERQPNVWRQRGELRGLNDTEKMTMTTMEMLRHGGAMADVRRREQMRLRRRSRDTAYSRFERGGVRPFDRSRVVFTPFRVS
jgi:hypothetical protein